MHDDGVCGLILVNVCGFVVMGGWKRGCGININGSGGVKSSYDKQNLSYEISLTY